MLPKKKMTYNKFGIAFYKCDDLIKKAFKSKIITRLIQNAFSTNLFESAINKKTLPRFLKNIQTCTYYQRQINIISHVQQRSQSVTLLA